MRRRQSWFVRLGRGLRQFFRPKTVGTRSERAAEWWLRRNRGFSTVARNWRNPHDRREEIDLICMDGEILVFIEVKARSATALVPGFFAIDSRKKRVLRRAIRAYLRGLRTRPHAFRFDVVEVSLAAHPDRNEVLHFENVALD